MNPLALLALLATFSPARSASPAPSARPEGQMPKPYPEETVFVFSIPRAARPVPKASPAWDARVALDAKGLPLRAVLAGVLDQAKVSYAIDPALDASVYASVKETSLRDAVAVLARVCEFEIKSDAGVWYAVRKAPKPAPRRVATLRNVPVDPMRDPAFAVSPRPAPPRPSAARPMVGAISAQGLVLPAPRRQTFPVGATVGATPGLPLRPALSVARAARPKAAAKAPAARPARPAPAPLLDPAPIARPAPPLSADDVIAAGGPAAPDLTRRVATRLARTDLRAVLAALSAQTGVRIALDESVPRYRVDAFFRATSLRYALNEIAKAAGLEWRVEGAVVRVSPKL